MINKTKFLTCVLAAASTAVAVNQPGAFSEGSNIGGNSWKFSYTAVARPPLTPGQHIKIQTDASHTEGSGPTVFHRFFTDPVTHTYFGYDLVVEPVGQSHAAIVKFQPLSLRGNQLPAKYAAAEYRSVGLPRFPAQTFKSGQTIAVDVLENPGNGQKVTDYIQVAFVPAGDEKSTAHEGVALAAQDVEKAKTIGNPAAPIRIELYSDFQCPGCKAFHEAVLPVLIQQYITTGKAYLVSHEFPLTMHPYSREAANYATAAAEIGKYQPVVDVLFRNQADWGASGKVWETVSVALSPAEQMKVKELAQSPATLALVQQDVDLAMAQRVGQTPTLYLSRGSRRYPFAGPGPDNYPLLKSLIEELMR
ncbi:MAG TPA: thioredoxin domain-containing protein [Bryobacteraceae bacterium]|nr:thioredoxin domain-containing protein [Bryobacteraceae bacterium]